MTDFPRLIEHAFPLKQTSLDSVHEKNVRHGHISTLHIWPARRPLAACRAALIATLLPDPGTPEGRKELCEKIAGRVVRRIEKKKMPNGQTVERIKEETEGGILHWGREVENAETLEWFRQEIRKAYGGRAPKVLDPFAGGGAIPLEAMRLGCEATAVDINPVAWFILKCTLEYPQKLAGQKRPLPAFILKNEAFMEAFYKTNPNAVGKGKATKKQKGTLFVDVAASHAPEADLAWHVRAWGHWVLDRARRELAQYYPTYADFEPIKKDRIAYEHQPMRLVPLKDDGTADIDSFNAEFTKDYLEDGRNPRWVAKPTVAHLWARTATCKNCRSTVPLLKTRWLCKKKDGRKRVLLTMAPNPNRSGVIFGIDPSVPAKGGNAAQKREHDKRLAGGTMSRAGVQCPCCNAINTMQDIRLEGKAGRLGSVMTAVVVNSPGGKDYRLPTEHELAVATPGEDQVQAAFDGVPFGVPDEPTPAGGGSGAGRAFSVQSYGVMKWRDLFTPRQLTALGTFVAATRAARDEMAEPQVPGQWIEAVGAYLACAVDRLVDFANVNTQWKLDADTLNHAMVRYAIQITWDFAEGNPIGTSAGAYQLCFNRIATGLETLALLPSQMEAPTATRASAQTAHGAYDLVLTDPPYYDAIPYSDLMDWFYIFLRRMVGDLTPDHQAAMTMALAPKWDGDNRDGELVDDCSRHGGDAKVSKQAYEDGMATVFGQCFNAIVDGGRLVIVFANKSPNAWETLVSAVIRAGFVVDCSWPIQTEQPSRTRGISSAALASSVWLVCKKRPATAKPGWDNKVLEEMRANIAEKLRAFWDAGIRGPDFVWAATGPAMEAYSKHPVVRKANEPNATMGVGEFLNHVRRMVVDYVVGQVLSGEHGADMAAADRLDDVTAYYLLHRHDFGMDEAPVGACILYATACGLSDSELDRTWDILSRTGRDSSGSAANDDSGDAVEGDAESEPSEDDSTSGGSNVMLKAWSLRRSKSMGYEAPASAGGAVPLIDRIHRVMHLWKDGDVQKVDEYLDQHALRRNELFKRVVQSLIELSTNSERSLLESISNHIGGKGAVKTDAEAQAMAARYAAAGHGDDQTRSD